MRSRTPNPEDAVEPIAETDRLVANMNDVPFEPFVFEGEMIDHDDYVYRSGDLVLLKRGTRHNSRTENGCLLAAFIAAPERNIEAG